MYIIYKPKQSWITRLGIFFLIGIFFSLLPSVAYASSAQAYSDYLYQSDLYRQKNNEFSIAKNEYLKFKTLSAESDAIAKSKEMLSQRSILLRSYLTLLNEKLNEATNMSDSDKKLYKSLLDNESSFLDNHSKFVNSVATTTDATKASQQLEEHYVILSTSMRQIILGLTVSRLNELANKYSDNMVEAQTLLNSAKQELPLDRQTTLDRWFQKVSDKRSLYLQDIQSITDAKEKLKGSKVEEVDAKFKQILNQVTQAKQELTEGNSYMNELMNAMLYKN